MILVIDVLLYQNLLIPKTALLFLSILMLKILLKNLIRNEKIILATKNPIKFFYLYKIKNFTVNWCYVIIYFLIFIIFILSFRLYRLGYTLDLSFIKQTFITLYLLKEFLLIFIFILLLSSFCLIIALFLKKIKNFLEIHVIQRHLYLINYQNTKDYNNAEPVYPPNSLPYWSENERGLDKNSYIKNGFYKKIYYYFHSWSYGILLNWVSEITRKVWVKFIKNTRFHNSEIFNFRKHFQIISDTKYNFIIILTMLIYELVYYDFKIKFLFLVLPFYFLYTLWYKLSKFWYFNRIPFLDIIMYDLYYNYPNVIYLNLDQNHFDILSRYIIGSLNQPNSSMNNDYSDAFSILQNHRFILCGNFYKNPNTKEGISIKDYENLTKKSTSQENASQVEDL